MPPMPPRNIKKGTHVHFLGADLVWKNGYSHDRIGSEIEWAVKRAGLRTWITARVEKSFAACMDKAATINSIASLLRTKHKRLATGWSASRVLFPDKFARWEYLPIEYYGTTALTDTNPPRGTRTVSSWCGTYGIRPVHAKDHQARPCNPRVRSFPVSVRQETLKLPCSLKLQRDKLKQYQKKV